MGNVTVNDIILGRFWIDLSCDIHIQNLKTGDRAELRVKPCKGRLKERGRCEGRVLDAAGNECYNISGSTLDRMFVSVAGPLAQRLGVDPAPVLMWQKSEPVPDMVENYNMPRFAIEMNDPADPIVPGLPPTDARFRPDQRNLELGEWTRATEEKLRLEEKQRQARKDRKDAGVEYTPMWFKKVNTDPKEVIRLPEQRGEVWQFKSTDYFNARIKRDWQGCPDIYS